MSMTFNDALAFVRANDYGKCLEPSSQEAVARDIVDNYFVFGPDRGGHLSMLVDRLPKDGPGIGVVAVVEYKYDQDATNLCVLSSRRVFVRHDAGKPSNGRMTLRDCYWKAKGEYVSRGILSSHWQWRDEGRDYAVQDYFSHMGEFTDDDWKFASSEDIADICREVEREDK